MVVVQRVATKWRDVAQNSNKIRRALFLKPSFDERDKLALPIDGSKLTPTDKDLITQGRWQPPMEFHMDFKYSTLKKDLQSDQYYCSAVLFNPMLGSLNNKYVLGIYVRHVAEVLTDGSDGLDPLGMARLISDTERVLSCQKMFFTQPPTPCLDVRLFGRIRGPLEHARSGHMALAMQQSQL